MDTMSLAELTAAKEEAEAAQRRSAFLAEASALLAASLDYEATLSSLARLTVPRVADYCILYEIDEHREVRQVACAHVDPAKEPLLHRLGELYRPSLDNPDSFVARAVLSEGPLLLPSVSPETARTVTQDEALLAIYRQLAPRSAVVLPLAARGQALGSLLLATAESGRTYGESDLELGRELATRAAVAMDNARLYREAQRANAAKDQFLATLSHELRTPLAPVLAVVSALESDPRLRDLIGGALAVIRRNVELEARLIDDLLDLTRISRGKLELHVQPSDLRDALAHALQSCSAEEDASGKWIAVETELAAIDHTVCADVPRLTQVFWNLLKNAFKFTPDGGSIRVRTRNAGDGIEVEFSDTGIGIGADLLPRIFDSFEQGERSITRRFGGLGLGLAISKALVELHKGRIAVSSDGEGRGATFTVWLPRAAPRVIEDARTDSDTDGGRPDLRQGRPLRILLVEDHMDTAAALAELLDLMGHQVLVAHDVSSGLAAAATALQGEGLDLVISDLGLPDASGLDLMRELSGRHGLRGIALSGYGTENDIRASREAGFALHLTKPVDLERLRAALRD
ncbi:MAG TPA: ATP-binding protein [Thermoanaerobaculia bacterium]|nr:ATP-binding protein [Thermoanaerobaculia bacterium]